MPVLLSRARPLSRGAPGPRPAAPQPRGGGMRGDRAGAGEDGAPDPRAPAGPDPGGWGEREVSRGPGPVFANTGAVRRSPPYGRDRPFNYRRGRPLGPALRGATHLQRDGRERRPGDPGPDAALLAASEPSLRIQTAHLSRSKLFFANAGGVCPSGT